MRVFVTGASGFVGTAVTRQLIEAGHQVTGLARSETSAAAIEAGGATALRGDLADLDLLSKAAQAADGVIHCGFIHDFANFATSAEVDRQAIEAMGAALAGSGKPFLVTSGTAGLRQGVLGTEDDGLDRELEKRMPRVSEQTGLAQAERGIRAGVVRLPPSVHGDGDHGFIPGLIAVAREKGAVGYVGSGENRWSAVHVSDAAKVYQLALEQGHAGARHHAIGDQGIPMREIAAVIGRKLDLPVISVPREQAAEHFGWMAMFVQMDVPASSRLTSERLGWQPSGVGLLDDLEQGTYFDAL